MDIRISIYHLMNCQSKIESLVLTAVGTHCVYPQQQALNWIRKKEEKNLVFTLAFFHASAVVQERRKYSKVCEFIYNMLTCSNFYCFNITSLVIILCNILIDIDNSLVSVA